MSKRCTNVLGIVILLLVAILGFGGCRTTTGTVTCSDETRFIYSQIHMGSRVRIILYAPNEPAARLAARAAFARIAELDSILSDYRQDSEISRLCAGPAGVWTPISSDLFHVLERTGEISALTDGAFDCTLGPLTRLWRTARQRGVRPSTEALLAAKKKVGWQLVHLDSIGQAAMLEAEGMTIDFGAIGKGYAADQAVVRLKWAGVPRCLVEIGGDIAVGEPPPNETAWRIEIETGYGKGNHPVVLAADCGIATSGDVEQFVEVEGQRYSHILDPTTGLGLTTSTAATVLAPDGATADALASAACVLGPEGIRKVVNQMSGVGVRLVTAGQVIHYGTVFSQRCEPEYEHEESFCE